MHHLNSNSQSNYPQQASIINIKLLGGFHLHYQGEVVDTINTTRLQSLLAYLVLHKNEPVSRQHLAFLFWPDTSEAQARTNLRNLLYKLRSAFPDANRYIYTDKHMLQWQPSEHFALDVDEFTRLASQSTSIQDLEAAVEIYSGDLVPDCYDEWIQSLRESLRQTYLTSLEKLLILLTESKQQDDAIYYSQILLRCDPTHEETYRNLMRFYAQRGDRAGVARIYKTCVTVLDRELDVKPSLATEEAYQKWITYDTDWTAYSQITEIHSQGYSIHNLPASITSFIGRERELEQVTVLLSDHRLVTLIGPGGIGKTRLALASAMEILSRYRDGIFLVDLAPTNDPGMITLAISDALQANDEIRASGIDGVINHLSDQSLLLILDNCEHLTKDVGDITLTLLRACPYIRILITSREALNVYGETVWRVPALPTPRQLEKWNIEASGDDFQELQVNESVKLFIERAVSTLPTFTTTSEILLAIGEICHRLEGIPLAIEMAAARVKTLSVQQIFQRLDNVFDLLKHPAIGAFPRHGTMEAVMEWSYALLVPTERNLFMRLSAFSGDFSLQAAEKVCAGQGIQEAEILDLLASLIDKSLVETLPTVPETRFKLHEVARQFAQQRLRTHEPSLNWQNRHLDYFLVLTEEAEPKLRTGEQLEWLNRLEIEQENLRAALRWALDKENAFKNQHVEAAARMVSALWLFWFIRGRFSEGRRWAEQALASLNHTGNTSLVLGKVLYTAASFCLFQGEYPRANELSQRSLTISKTLKDIFGEVVSYHHLGLIAKNQGELVQAEIHLSEGYKSANYLGDPWLISMLAEDLAHLAIAKSHPEDALKQFQLSLDIARKVGDTFTILYNLTNIAELALQQGDFQQAVMLTEESLSLSRVIGEMRGISFALERLGRIAVQEGKYQRADELLKQSLEIIWGTRDRETTISYLVHLADNASQQEKFEFAARLLAACEAALSSFPNGFRWSEQAIFDRLVENIRTQLELGVFTAAWTLGRLMNLEQVVSYALLDHAPNPGN